MEAIKIIHAVSGITVAVSGLLQIILKKGGTLHRIIGLIYFWVWIAVVVTGGMLGSLLITLFGVLGYYMALTGYRFGHRKNVQLNLFDKSVIVAGILFSAVTLGWGILLMIKGNTVFGGIASFFGSIFLLSTVGDLRAFILKQNTKKLSNHKMQWLFEHYGRMYISYIAAMTAFTVIQNPLPLMWMNWILPTFIGTALLIISNRRNYRKFGIKG